MPLNNFSKLLKNPPQDLFVDVYNGINKVKKEPAVKEPKTKYTLNQLGKKVDQIGDALFNFINYATNEFKQLNTRIDNVETRLDNLEKDVSQLKQDVKGINTRLDYIVTANKLKDLSNNR